MVYEPRETPLLAAARARGCATIDGVEMLVAQAVGQFEAWTGKAAPVEEMTAAALAAMAEVLSICDRLLHNAHCIALKGPSIRNTRTDSKTGAQAKA
jgi:hypothetical protein